MLYQAELRAPSGEDYSAAPRRNKAPSALDSGPRTSESETRMRYRWFLLAGALCIAAAALCAALRGPVGNAVKKSRSIVLDSRESPVELRLEIAGAPAPEGAKEFPLTLRLSLFDTAQNRAIEAVERT